MAILRGVGLLLLLMPALGCSSREDRSDEALERGNAAADRKDYDTAISEFTEAIRLDPQSDGAYHGRASAYADKGEYARAVADYNEAIRLAPDDPASLTSLAWLLATCPDAGHRDGKRAVELATRACKLSGWKDANDLENLAAGYAECGQFDQAVKWQTKALEDAEFVKRSGETGRKALKLYEQKKPYRQ